MLIQNVSGYFGEVYHTPRLLFWGVFLIKNCGRINKEEDSCQNF